MLKLSHDDKSINLPELPNVWKTSNFYIVWRIWITTRYSSILIIIIIEFLMVLIMIGKHYFSK